MRSRYTFLREEMDVAGKHNCAPRGAPCWGRLMCLMPDAVTTPVEYLSELSLPYFGSPVDLK